MAWPAGRGGVPAGLRIAVRRPPKAARTAECASLTRGVLWYPGRPEERKGDGAFAPSRRPRGSAPARRIVTEGRDAEGGLGRVLKDPSRACSADRPTRRAPCGRACL